MRKVIIILWFFTITQVIVAQNITSDTTLAGISYRRAKVIISTNTTEKFDSILILSQQAATLYSKHSIMIGLLSSLSIQIEAYARTRDSEHTIILFDSIAMLSRKELGKKNLFLANAYHYQGLAKYYSKEYEDALLSYAKGLDLRRELLGVINLQVAQTYNNIGLVYSKLDHKKAIEYWIKAAEIRKEILGEKNLDIAANYDDIGYFSFFLKDYDKALLYLKRALKIQKELLGRNKIEVAYTLSCIGEVYFKKAENDSALVYHLKSSEIRREYSWEKDLRLAVDYYNLGYIYMEKFQNGTALDYLRKSLKIRKELLGEDNLLTANCYELLGIGFLNNSEYEKALENILKAIEINEKIHNEKNLAFAALYSTAGSIYASKSELDKSLEYYTMSLNLIKGLVGEKYFRAAFCYVNIGMILMEKSDLSKALEYLSMGLKILIEHFGEKNQFVIDCYTDLGIVYSRMKDYDKSLEYHLKALELSRNLSGEKSISVAACYSGIGSVYASKSDYNKALDFYFTALYISREILGEKHDKIAGIYTNIGYLYEKELDYDKALQYYQKALYANVIGFNDTINLAANPVSKNFLDYKLFLNSLDHKAEIFKDLAENSSLHSKALTIKKTSNIELLQLALKSFQLCDTIITKTRIKIDQTSDKIALGDIACSIYEHGIYICLRLAESSPEIKAADYREQGFYFSEKNKSVVLLGALADQEGLKFAGISDTLLQKEHSFKVDIKFYEKKLAEKPDSSSEILYRNYLFTLNRQYEDLISLLEKDFPEYYDLKYSTKNPSVKEIQNTLDNKTAILTYFIGDSINFLFTLSKDQLKIKQFLPSEILTDSLLWFRYSLTNTSPRMQKVFNRLGYSIYRHLFPDTTALNPQIENLIIIPDGSLSTIPFESLLTYDFKKSIVDYKDYPFLIKKYNISYSYSVNLYFNTTSKGKSTKVELTNLNDWLALAPVFDGDTKQGLTLATRELQNELNSLKVDTLMNRRALFERDYISSLPATKSETESIYKLFEGKGLKASLLLYSNANEKFLKSGGLNKYRILHLATHGFVNSERPELSGLLLAQDTTGGEDGTLYSGEIYNLHLKADLVVLSACETGLGKIQKGEGIIGLTRALLYAGGNNIIVSLWQVSDQSTSDLMVDFYKNLLSDQNQFSYSQSLRKAKLKMIGGKIFSHPQYWSPFILIGN